VGRAQLILVVRATTAGVGAVVVARAVQRPTEGGLPTGVAASMSLLEGLLDAISGAESGFIALVFVMPLENLNKLHAGAPEGTST
jgi:hypothetical protein